MNYFGRAGVQFCSIVNWRIQELFVHKYRPKLWVNEVSSRRKLKTWVYLRLRLARSCMDLRWRSMACAHFGRDQICTQGDASFPPFGHSTQVNARWVTSINLLLISQWNTGNACLGMGFLRLACTCEETCKSVWSPTFSTPELLSFITWLTATRELFSPSVMRKREELWGREWERGQFVEFISSRESEIAWSNISKTSASVSSGVPNTEKQMKARGRRPSAFIVSRCLEPLMKHEARVFGIAS